jgi:hypothetical protein
MNFRALFLAPPLLLAACDGAGPSTDASSRSQDAASDVAPEGDDVRSVDATSDVSPPDTDRATRCPSPPTDPLSRGDCELRDALVEGRLSARVSVRAIDDPRAAALAARAPEALAAAAESWAVLRDAGELVVVGRDRVGAMYGAFELAERIRLDGAAAIDRADTMRGAPAVRFRAANLFLTLPEPGDARWWFRDDGFWDEYLDLLMRARINTLDMHGMYDMHSTIFPNALLYFATSATHPAVGVAASERARNLDVLRRVVAKAASRGIRVALMTYRSDTHPLGLAEPQALTRDDDLRTYTREAAEALARAVPGLWALGFRIGESERPAAWYADTFIRGVHDAATGVRVYLRTWLAPREDVLALRAAAGEGFVAEAKYNGEQLGAPYPIAGGAWSGPWAQYTHESYLDATPDFDFVFQVRAGGTHRIFRHATYALTQRAVVTTTLGGAAGFSFEPTHAFYPQRSFFHVSSGDDFSSWTFRRDELTYQLWGRLSYDPTTPERVFRATLARRLGNDALWEPMQAASSIIPWVAQGMSCGPDHRDHAPELEWNGDVAYLATPPNQAAPAPRACTWRHGPLDSFAVAGPWEAARDLLADTPTTRLSPRDVALTLLDAAARARRASAVAIDPRRSEARSVQRECVALADLAEYHAHKLRAATALAVYRGSLAEPWLAYARRESAAAVTAWRALVGHTSYIAEFTDNLRMVYLGIPRFHWRREQAWVDADAAALDAAALDARTRPPTFTGELPAPEVWEAATRQALPTLVEPAASWHQSLSDDRRVRFVFSAELPTGAAVRVLWKPINAREDWRSLPATVAGAGRYEATLPGDAARVLVALEVTGPTGIARRLPDPRAQTPYWVYATR